MESLRWILLVAGIFFVLAIYFLGRQRHRHNNSDLIDNKQDLPEFSARDWDDVDETVGDVRVVAHDLDADDFSVEQVQQHYDAEQMVGFHEAKQDYQQQDDQQQTELSGSEDLVEQTDEVDESLVESSENEIHDIDSSEQTSPSVDIIVLYVLAKHGEVLSGEKINSAARANGFTFGSMNIYHCLDGDGQTIFSMANMIEPGNFDPDSIHDMTTSGLTIFMQLSNVSHPADDFDAMLNSAYHMSEMLGASLCNQNRQLFTQADAEYYRNLISEKENA